MEEKTAEGNGFRKFDSVLYLFDQAAQTTDSNSGEFPLSNFCEEFLNSKSEPFIEAVKDLQKLAKEGFNADSINGCVMDIRIQAVELGFALGFLFGERYSIAPSEEHALAELAYLEEILSKDVYPVFAKGPRKAA